MIIKDYYLCLLKILMITFWTKGSGNNTEFFNYWNSVYNKFSEDISSKYQETDKELSRHNTGFLRAFYGFGKNARDDLPNGKINIKKDKPKELPEGLDF